MNKKTILAVDDTSMGLKTIKTILDGSYTVRLAKTTQIAFGVLEAEKIDLVLLDIELPGDLSGIDFLKAIKSKIETRDIPVIMVTGHASLKLISESTRLGAQDYVVKPLNPDSLRQKVQSIWA